MATLHRPSPILYLEVCCRKNGQAKYDCRRYRHAIISSSHGLFAASVTVIDYAFGTQVGNTLSGTLGRSFWGRYAGPLGHPNKLGYYLVLTSTLSLQMVGGEKSKTLIAASCLVRYPDRRNLSQWLCNSLFRAYLKLDGNFSNDNAITKEVIATYVAHSSLACSCHLCVSE